MLILISKGFHNPRIPHLMAPTMPHHLALWVILTPTPFIMLALFLHAVFAPVTLIVMRQFLCYKHL